VKGGDLACPELVTLELGPGCTRNDISGCWCIPDLHGYCSGEAHSHAELRVHDSSACASIKI
jgi:hypothetical protein